MLDDNCLFCKIIKGEIPSTKVYEDEYVYAFNDINPEAPIHVLIVPKKHITSILDIKEEDKEYIQKIMEAAQKIAKELNVDESGFRFISNCGKDAGQTVDHLHFHLLAGKHLGERVIA